MLEYPQTLEAQPLSSSYASPLPSSGSFAFIKHPNFVGLRRYRAETLQIRGPHVTNTRSKLKQHGCIRQIYILKQKALHPLSLPHRLPLRRFQSHIQKIGRQLRFVAQRM
jgi:hypothetical protein